MTCHHISAVLATAPPLHRPQHVPDGWHILTRGDGSRCITPLFTTLAAGLGDASIWDGTRPRQIEIVDSA